MISFPVGWAIAHHVIKHAYHKNLAVRANKFEYFVPFGINCDGIRISLLVGSAHPTG